MDIKQIQELVKLINKSNIGELSIEENDFKITIRQKKNLLNTLQLLCNTSLRRSKSLLHPDCLNRR